MDKYKEGVVMNLLEHYIEQVISIENVNKEWEEHMQDTFPGYKETDPMLEVKMVVDCYGNKKETKKYFHKSQWEVIQKQGYYIG